MAVYFLDNDQQLIKIVPDNGAISILQTQELPEDSNLLKDVLSVHLKNDERLFDAQYMAIKSYDGNRNSFDMYRIVNELVPDNATEFEGVQVAPYELEGVVVEDLRPQGWTIERTVNQVLKNSDWRLGYTDDDLPKVSTNFYYLSVKDSLKKLQELTGVEFTFKVEISGNKITDKWVEVYKELGNRTLKRFNYGTNALTVKRETNHSELYTALIGRGKGEEVGETESGDATYGRKINFADIEWKKSAGKPVDKPKGQKYIELPEATAEFGVKMLNGRKVPRIGLVEFSDTEDPEVLINQTWQALQEYARPKVLFSAIVANIGDTGIGDTVTIHRHDLNMHYKTRVRKVMRNRKNNDKTQVEIGDVVYTASTKQQANINSQLNNMQNDLSNVKGEVSHVVTSADGKNNITYSNIEPERKKVGDSWVRDHPSLAGETQWLVWNGEAWELILDTSETALNKEAIEQAQQDIAEAQATADEAVEQIDTAVANAGFTSLDDTLQNMNDITMNAEQSAQQAITDASNAYGLAQTSISEAQTAQANSLTALGKADNALDGVSSLDVRVDDVEAELELKADNTFMNEDGTLTTLSNAIAFNAHRFSSDMSHIESRVESLAGEINLVILRDAFEGKALNEGDTFPNPSRVRDAESTMREMIKVVPGEELALTKETVASGSNYWRINFYDSDSNYVNALHTNSNEELFTIPSNVHYIWVSYTTGSKPQIVRGTDFIPYRPNVADQMTTNEMVIFRNEYDEFANRTERRLTAVDSSGGRLDVAENLIAQTANGLTLKADQSTVDTLAGTVQSLGTEFDIVAGQVNSRVWNTDIETAIDGIEVGGRNLFVDSNRLIDSLNPDKKIILGGKIYGAVEYEWFYNFTKSLEKGTYTISVPVYNPNDVRSQGRLNLRTQNISHYDWVMPKEEKILSYTFVINESYEDYRFHILTRSNNETLYFGYAKLEKGNKATDWTPAPEDTDAKIDHIETEWTQTFDAFSQTVSSIDGRVTAQKQTIDSITSTVSGHGNRISKVEQTASGLQSTVADKASQSQVTQLADLVDTKVTSSQVNSLIKSDKTIKDTRDDNESPEWYYDNYSKETVREFKRLTTMGISGEGTSGILETVIPWSDPSGGGIKQTLTTDHSVWERSGTGTGWRKWKKTADVDWVGSQISILEDNINLRVEKGDVINQINISDENILIQANKIMALGDVVVDGKLTITDEFIAPNAQIDGAKIADATIGSAKIANLDVDKISGNKAQLVEAGFNGINSFTHIDSEGIHMLGSGTYRRTYVTPTGFDLYNGSGATNKAGAIGYFKEHPNSANSDENYMRTTEGGRHFVGIGVNRSHSFAIGYNEYTTTPNGYDRALVVSGKSGAISLLRSTTMGNGMRLRFTGGSYIGEAANSQHFNINAKGQIRLYNSIDSLKVRIGADFDMYSDLNMNSNNIYNNSDRNLKKNILSTKLNSLNAIKEWKFVDYEWIDESKEGVYMGVIAQDTPEIASYNEETGFYAINSSKQLMMTTHALHELALNHDVVAQLAKTNERKIHKLQQELSKANRRIEELEGVM